MTYLNAQKFVGKKIKTNLRNWTIETKLA